MNSFKTVNSIFVKNLTNPFTAIADSASRNIVIVDLYTQLNEYTVIVNEYLNLFSSGKRAEVIQIFTEAVYLDLSLKLANLEVDPQKYPEYEQTRLSLISALRTLRVALTINTELKNTQVTNTAITQQLNEANLILASPAALKDLIQNFNNRGVIFPDMNIQAPMATLYPEYEEYIRLYGYDGSFEPDKLAAIKKRLGIV